MKATDKKLKVKELSAGEIRAIALNRFTTPSSTISPLSEMKFILMSMGLNFEPEYKFSNNRKFKFDLALPNKMIAIEYEGLFSKKSRHTTATGYSMDTEKYNLAVIEGWRVLRYTRLNYKKFYDDMIKILNK